MKADQYIEIIKRLTRIENLLLLINKCSCKDAIGQQAIDAPSNPNRHLSLDGHDSIFKKKDRMYQL